MLNRNRTSLRLPYYDYSQEGAYFVTIVTNKHSCLFGTIIDGEMILNDAGKMIDKVCQELPLLISQIQIKPYVIMPNHFHAVFIINDNDVGVDLRVYPGQPRRVAPTEDYENIKTRTSLPNVIGRFKSLTTRRYVDGVEKHNWSRFDNRLWQRNYYEHVIRDERDYEVIVDYILCNPQNWEKDGEFHG